MAYRLLPVSDLPNVDFPTLQVSANLPGASPETMASSVATPLERQFSTIAGVESMTSSNSLGSTSITLSVRAGPGHRRRGPGCAGGDRGHPSPAARGHAQPTVVPQGQPGRLADPLHRPHLAEPPALRARRVRPDDAGAADLDGERRGSGAGLRIAEVRGARPARPQSPGQPRARHRRGGGGDPLRQREPPHRHAAGRAEVVHDPDLRAALRGRGLPTDHRGLPQRPAGTAARSWDG